MILEQPIQPLPYVRGSESVTGTDDESSVCGADPQVRAGRPRPAERRP